MKAQLQNEEIYRKNEFFNKISYIYKEQKWIKALIDV